LLVFVAKASSTRLVASTSGTRNPERSRERILVAAFKEFAAKGFAGARVDTIARRASINKRMLYHYFGDKEALFREVLRRKMAERQAWGLATPDLASESLPYWFDLARKDKGWVRLLEWEALQFAEGKLIDEDRRRASAGEAVQRILRRQSRGHLTNDFEAPQILLAMLALTWFPVAFPQLTKFITGKVPSDEAFVREQRNFLKRFAKAFEAKASMEAAGRPSANGHEKLE
jgi:TetR/AcrR family transcriptional regulator